MREEAEKPNKWQWVTLQINNSWKPLPPRLEGKKKKGAGCVTAAHHEVGAKTVKWELGPQRSPSAVRDAWVKGAEISWSPSFLQPSLQCLPLAESGRKSAHGGAWEMKDWAITLSEIQNSTEAEWKQTQDQLPPPFYYSAAILIALPVYKLHIIMSCFCLIWGNHPSYKLRCSCPFSSIISLWHPGSTGNF